MKFARPISFLVFTVIAASTNSSAQSAVDPADSPAGKVYTFAERMPEFLGNLGEWLSSNLQYPKEAIAQKEEGKVVVRFVVSQTGEVRDPVVVRSVSRALDAEALRVARAMPRWRPGTQDGEAVSVNYTLPINFRLQ